MKKNLKTHLCHKKKFFGLAIFTMVFGMLQAQTTITSVINQGSDDQEEYVATGTLDVGSSDLELVNEGGGDQIIGLRFTNLNIPQGAIIINAYLQLTADNLHSGVTTLNIKGEATDSSVTFTTNNNTVSSRTQGTESATWLVDPWTVIQEQSLAQKSSDIKNVIQEIINRGGWKADNALTLLITGSGKREAESFEGASSGTAGHNAGQAPTLVVTYEVPQNITLTVDQASDDQEEYVATGVLDVGSSDLELINEGGGDQLIGIRFNGVNVPQGGNIISAYLQFTADNVHSGATTLNIKGEATDSSVTFAATNNAVSSRPTGTATATWALDPWAVIQERGLPQRSSDIKNVIQEIINRPGWNPGSSLALILTGNGKREAESFEGATSGAAGHNASQAPTLHIEFSNTSTGGGNPAPPIGVFPVPSNAIWRYLDNGADLGTAWTDSSFNDSTWAFGNAELGYGDGGEITPVGFGADPNNKYITTYFRHAFEISALDLSIIDSVKLGLKRDDGAIVYINGNEVFRSNMPTGAVTYQTVASSNVSGASENNIFYKNIAKQFLMPGKNVISVEIHQDVATSTDISFSLSADPVRNNITVIAPGSDWKYADNGNHPGSSWTTASFNDAAWLSGLAPLGYGNGNEATTISYGTDVANKYVTSYFRKSFAISATDTIGFTALQLKLKRDDGAVVYLNGTEVYRNNMPVGTVDNYTLANAFVEGTEEDMFITVNIHKNVLVVGSNIAAVELHQNSTTSTDARFDLSLVLPTSNPAVDYTNYNVACDPALSNSISCFTSVNPSGKGSLFTYPATHTFQKLFQSTVDTYSKGGIIPNGNDFTGFVPMTGSSRKGWVNVNHENTPGAVSIVDVEFNDSTALWEVDSINSVDWTSLVRTVRNCSGAVTPWETYITSEETYTTGDVNTDGYEDIGWNVEIDPRTRKIKDYNGDGQPDKLWALGRMSHENVVVANDSITVYQGEDGGTGCVYKFVANQKGNLSAGNLFVLKRDSVTATTGVWIQVPNISQAERNTTSTLAGSLGGTKFGGVEDVEIGPLDNMIYFAEKGNGDVWRFTDNGTTVSALTKFVKGNQLMPIVTTGGIIGESWSTGNDNLAFDNEGNMWVLQDGGKDHMWVVRPTHTEANPKVDLFGTSPTGSEPTGITFTPDNRYAFISFQNSSPANTQWQIDAAGDTVVHNSSVTFVIARKEYLGGGAVFPVVNLGNDTTICTGQSVVFSDNAPDAINTWSNGSHGNSLTVNASGTFYLTSIGNNGKIYTDSVDVIVNPLPVPFVGNDTAICSTCSVTLNAGSGYAQYLWSTGATTQTINVSAPGTYSVTVEDQIGCEGTDAITITTSTGLEEATIGYDLDVYPNPFMEEVKINLNLASSSDVSLTVFDVIGSKVSVLIQDKLNSGNHIFEFNTSAFKYAKGVYFLKAEINGKTNIIKLINY